MKIYQNLILVIFSSNAEKRKLIKSFDLFAPHQINSAACGFSALLPFLIVLSPYSFLSPL